MAVDRLVGVSGLSHRSVLDLLRRLEPWIESGPQGYQLRAAIHGHATAEVDLQDLQPLVARLIERAPAPRRRLDHVAATPDTCRRRASFLAGRYWLSGARVLFLGDHDLTSLALALLRPGARLSVVDLDDDLLEYIDRTAAELGVEVDCWFADLRLGIPPALRESADLVFTDPPYTPEGVRLFAARGCQALRRGELSRLLLCYGYGERQPALGLKAQTVLHRLRLLLEEVQPRFNRYAGAQAVGGASALYVARPTTDTWRSIDHEALDGARIYSHGPMAVESRQPALPEELQRSVADPVPLGDLWRLNERHATARPGRRPPLPEVAAADLRQVPELAPRLLLTNRVACLQLVLATGDANALLQPNGWPARLFGASYDMTQTASHGGLSVVEAVRHQRTVTGEAALARHLVDHPAATLVSSLREALIREGVVGTKNEGRAIVSRYPDLEAHRDARAADVPRHVLQRITELLGDLVAGGA